MTLSNSEIWRDPALPFVESRRACHSRACYKAHSHPTFSIGAVDAGLSWFTGAGDGQARLTPGTLVLVPAQRVHACNPESGQAWSYQMVHVDAQWLGRLRLESGVSAAEPGAPARITRSAEVYRQFCQLNALLFSDAAPSQKEAALVAFIGDHDFAAHATLDAARPCLERPSPARADCHAADVRAGRNQPGASGRARRVGAIPVDPGVPRRDGAHTTRLPAQ